MKNYLSKTTFLLFIIVALSFGTSSIQPDHATTITTPKSLTAKDKAVIVEVFKTIREEDYRIKFNNKELYGKRELPDGYISALRTGKLLDDVTNSYLAQSLQPNAGFWFFINKDSSLKLEDVFGKSNAARLQAVINKYTGAK